MTHTTYSNTKSMLIVGSIVALSMVALTNPAAAYYPMHNDDDTTVSNTNSAYVNNTVSVGSNTGGNSVVGGNTGAGGDGGNAHGSQATAGNGGTSGGSNNDGLIQTGDAAALSSITNRVNTNRTKITTDCGCEGQNGDVEVTNSSKAKVGNTVAVDANTGYNAVVGGTSGAAGNGGNASAHSWSKWNHHMAGHGASASAGNGGNTGTSNNLGTIVTGDALSDSVVVNVVNRNLTRVR